MRKLIFIIAPLFVVSKMVAQQTKTNIYFETDKYEISTDGKRKLNRINDDTLIKTIFIYGYADYRASDSHNIKLSTNRAKAVENYLTKVKDKIQWFVGKGEIPSDNLDSVNGISLHRKTEVICVYKPTKKEKPIIKQNVDTQIKQLKKDTLSSKQLFNIDSVKVGQKVVLENLYFIGGRHFLRPESKNTAVKLVKILKDNPGLKIEIQGHICCKSDGGDGYDYDTKTNNLSANRAKYIHHYLVQNGISRGRLKYKGFARNKPLFPLERTPEEQNKNRRVEIKILDK